MLQFTQLTPRRPLSPHAVPECQSRGHFQAENSAVVAFEAQERHSQTEPPTQLPQVTLWPDENSPSRSPRPLCWHVQHHKWLEQRLCVCTQTIQSDYEPKQILTNSGLDGPSSPHRWGARTIGRAKSSAHFRALLILLPLVQS